MQCHLTLQELRFANVTERAMDAHFSICVSAQDTVSVGGGTDSNDTTYTIHYGTLIFPQSKTLLKGGNRWYLTSGTLDGPPAEAGLRKEPTDGEHRPDAPAPGLTNIAAGVDPADGRVAEALLLFQDALAWRQEFGIRQASCERIDDPRIIAALQILASTDSVDEVRCQAAEALSKPQPSGELRGEKPGSG